MWSEEYVREFFYLDIILAFLFPIVPGGPVNDTDSGNGSKYYEANV
jgi:hypothetical protein